MTEHIRFHFDPICPWCYQTSRWLRHVARLGAAEVTWGLFSLEVQNAGEEPEWLEAQHARSLLALRTGVAVREAAGSEGLGAFYGAIGWRVHRGGQALEDLDTVKGALDDAGLDASLVDVASGDQRYADAVVTEHRGLVESTRSFGVPTMVLDDGHGPAIFGPVISEPPVDDAETLDLFEHVVWLARYENFAELKRDRVVGVQDRGRGRVAQRPVEL